MNQYLNDNLNKINECFNTAFITQKNILTKCFVKDTKMINIANIEQQCIINNIKSTVPAPITTPTIPIPTPPTPITSAPAPVSYTKYYIAGIFIFILIVISIFIFIFIIFIFCLFVIYNKK